MRAMSWTVSIPDHVVGAPLKDAYTEGGVRPSATIPDHVVGAPLKDRVLEHLFRGSLDNPRPRGRGSVEGAAMWNAGRKYSTIPDHVVGAPLKVVLAPQRRSDAGRQSPTTWSGLR